MSGIIGLVIAILVAILFAWLAVRAWHLRNPALRIVTGLLASLLTLGFVAISVVGLVGAYRLYTPHGGPPGNLTAQANPDQLTTASRRMSGCTGCHSSTSNLPLDGGSENMLGGPIGTVFAPNLTPAGPLKERASG